MKTLNFILLGIIIVIITACDNPDTVTTDFDIFGTKKISLNITGLYPIFGNGQEYWKAPKSYFFVADTLYFIGDTLYFTYNQTTGGKLFIDKKSNELKTLFLSLYHTWTREWYDYNVPKWDPNYHRMDKVENFIRVRGSNIQAIQTNKLKYFLDKNSFNSKWNLEFDLYYDHSQYNLTDKITYPDSLGVEIILEK
jgi:hypothetical protein